MREQTASILIETDPGLRVRFIALSDRMGIKRSRLYELALIQGLKWLETRALEGSLDVPAIEGSLNVPTISL